MKKTLAGIVMVAVLSLSGYAAAASGVSQSTMSDNMGLMAAGSISVSHQATLSDIEQALQAKTEKSGASRYQITSVSGNNMLHSTAIIYR